MTPHKWDAIFSPGHGAPIKDIGITFYAFYKQKRKKV